MGALDQHRRASVLSSVDFWICLSRRREAQRRVHWPAVPVAVVLAMGAASFYGAAAGASVGAKGHGHTTELSSEQITVLDAVLHIAQPSAQWLPSQKAWVLPKTAFIRPSSVGFTTDCGAEPGPWLLGNSRSWKYYRTTTGGTEQEACGARAIVETNKMARPGQYQGASTTWRSK
jgi:hypothetical protein